LITIINELANDLYSFFKPEAEQKRLQLFCKNTLSGKDATIKEDKDKLYAILTNLIKNAQRGNQGRVRSW
jgi:signal transduction histidine kinase